jgi:hypothetical protein
VKLRITYRISAFILALVLVSSTIYQTSVMVYYFAYQDYIIKELCVQKEDQQGCNGKCYLMKNLTNTVSENNSTIPPQNDKEFRGNFVFFLSKNAALNFNYLSGLESEKTEYHLQLKQSIFLEKEIPPPKFYI